MSLVKAVVYDVMDEGGAVEEHPLVGMVVIGLGYLLSPVHRRHAHLSDCVSFEDATSLPVVPVVTDSALHLKRGIAG